MLTLAAVVALLAVLGLMAFAQWRVDSSSTAARHWRPLAADALRGAVVRSLALLTVIPAFALALLIGARVLDDERARDTRIVTDAAQSVAAQIDAYVARHVAGVRGAAEAVAIDGRTDEGRLDTWLLRFHPIYPDFLTMIVVAGDGRVLAGTFAHAGRPRIAPTERTNVADRDYLRVPMGLGRDYVSGAFRGRGFGTDPLVAISSPIVIGGRPWGVVEGSLNLAAFGRLDTALQRIAGAHLILADAGGRVIYAAAATGLAPLAPAARSPLWTERASAAALPSPDRSALVAHVRTGLGWHVLVAKPAVGPLARIGAASGSLFAWLLACLAGAALLAVALARRTRRPLERLASGLATYELGQPSPFRGVRTLPAELRAIFRRLHHFVVRLAAGRRRLETALDHARRLQRELEATLAFQERTIADRTRELDDAHRELAARHEALQRREEHFRAVAEGTTVGMLFADPEGRWTYMNPAGRRILGLGARDPLPPDWSARYGFATAGDAPAVVPIAAGRDVPGWLQVRATPLAGEPGRGGVLYTFTDVTELASSRERIRALAQRIESVREEERASLARTLHEGLAQELFAAKLCVARLRLPGTPGEVRDRDIAELDELTHRVMTMLRDVSAELRPPGLGDVRFEDVLARHASPVAERAGLRLDLRTRPEASKALETLDAAARLALFRAAQEALTNVARHAGASRVSITLEATARDVRLVVADDGRGIGEGDPAKPGSFGLLGLRERLTGVGGTIEVRRGPQGGTRVDLRVPTEPAHAPACAPA